MRRHRRGGGTLHEHCVQRHLRGAGWLRCTGGHREHHLVIGFCDELLLIWLDPRAARDDRASGDHVESLGQQGLERHWRLSLRRAGLRVTPIVRVRPQQDPAYSPHCRVGVHRHPDPYDVGETSSTIGSTDGVLTAPSDWNPGCWRGATSVTRGATTSLIARQVQPYTASGLVNVDAPLVRSVRVEDGQQGAGEQSVVLDLWAFSPCCAEKQNTCRTSGRGGGRATPDC